MNRACALDSDAPLIGRSGPPHPRADLPTPRVEVDAQVAFQNLRRAAEYAAHHGLALRPHVKTHKSLDVARLQLGLGAVGLTVATAREAEVFSQLTDDILIAYPIINPAHLGALVRLALKCRLAIAIDSLTTARAIARAAESTGATIHVLIELDTGVARTGVQTPKDSLQLAQAVHAMRGLEVEGLMIYPGHLLPSAPHYAEGLRRVGDLLREAVTAWTQAGLEPKTVSGGASPTLFDSHRVEHLTEIRPGTYVYHDMNGVRTGIAKLEDCAARVIATVVSDAAPGQVVIDAGSKALSSDLLVGDPSGGFGRVIEYPQARITRLYEEHGLVDVSRCDARPGVGSQVAVVPNHVCTCVGLHEQAWWLDKRDGDDHARAIRVDARAR